jgi:hypothetical protein
MIYIVKNKKWVRNGLNAFEKKRKTNKNKGLHSIFRTRRFYGDFVIKL